MAITSTTTLPKFRALCRSLGMPQAWVLGHLEMFWQCCHTHGHVMRAEDFEEAAGWTEALPDRAGEFIQACIKHRWLDVDGDMVAAHDYLDNAPRFVKNREQTRERMARLRAQQTSANNVKQVQTSANNVKPFADVCKSLQCLTIEGEGEGDIEEEILNTHVTNQPAKPRRVAAKAATTHKYSEAFEVAWKAYPHHGGRSSKHESFERWHKMRLEAVAGLPELILRWIAWQAKQHDWVKQGGQFIPGMQVWLSKRPWVAGEPPAEEQREFGAPEDC